MATTTAQAQANQRNARKSTGPRTQAGKDRSRLNGLVHGLRAEQVVLPGEDPAAFEAELAGWFDDWKPTTHTRAVLVERAAVAAWRLRRCVRIETTRLRDLGNAAVRLHEAGARARVDAWVTRFEDDPAGAVPALMGEREGVVELLRQWARLADVLDDTCVWNATAHRLLLGLIGTNPGPDPREAGPLAVASWRLAIWADAEVGEASRDEFEMPGDAEAEGIVRVLTTYVAERSGGLRAYLQDRFVESAEFQARTADAASVDASAEGRLLLRYEATHDRSLRATVGLLVQLARTGLDLVDAPEIGDEIPTEIEPEPAAPSEPIGPKPDSHNDLPPSPAGQPVELPSTDLLTMSSVPAPRRECDRRARIWGLADPIAVELDC